MSEPWDWLIHVVQASVNRGYAWAKAEHAEVNSKVRRGYNEALLREEKEIARFLTRFEKPPAAIPVALAE